MSDNRWQMLTAAVLFYALLCAQCEPSFPQLLTVLLHVAEELDDDLGGRSDEDLSLALSLSVDDGLQAVVLEGKREGAESSVSVPHPHAMPSPNKSLFGDFGTLET